MARSGIRRSGGVSRSCRDIVRELGDGRLRSRCPRSGRDDSILRDGKQGFDFLGCHFRKRLSGAIWERERLYFLHRQPSQRAMTRIRQKVKERTPRGRCHADLRVVIKDLNPILRGWGAYFATGNAARSYQIDSYVYERLSAAPKVWTSVGTGAVGTGTRVRNGQQPPHLSRRSA
jgi:hypothetical protein